MRTHGYRGSAWDRSTASLLGALMVVSLACRSGHVYGSLDEYSYGIASRVAEMADLPRADAGSGGGDALTVETEGGVEIARAGPAPERAGDEGIAALAAELASRFDAIDRRRASVLDAELDPVRPRARVRLEIGGRRSGAPAIGRLDMDVRFRAGGSRLEVEAAARVALEIVTGGARRLVDRATDLGVTARHTQQCANYRTVALPGLHASPGCAIADLNGDGFPDIVLADGGRDRLYVNAAGRGFVERGGEAGFRPDGEGRGVLAFDLDGDGDHDVLVINADRDPDLYVNDGSGVFSEQGYARGMRGVFQGTMGSAADVDGDGLIDVFIACYGDAEREWPSLTGRNGEPDRLFVQRPGGTFVEMAEDAGADDEGWGLATAFADYDGDGDADLYIANDFGRNAMLLNESSRGRPEFDDVHLRTLTSDKGFGMSVAWGDYDEDLDLDLYVGNYYWEGRYVFDHPEFPMPPFPAPLLRRPIVRRITSMTRGNSLFENRPPFFVRVSEERGVADGGWAWASGFFDWDNDGDLDILSVNGWISGPDPTDVALPFWTGMITRYDQMESGGGLVDIGDRSLHGREPTRLFVNRVRGGGGPVFVEAAYAAAMESDLDGRSLAFGDLDRDGDTDVVITNHLEPPTVLMNEGPVTDGWLDVVLAGAASGIGAEVILESEGRRVLRQLACGDTFLSSSEPVVHFGLGESTKPVALRIRWPDGKTTRHDGVVPGRRYRVVESPPSIEPGR